jgi:hypothetical protein
VLKSIKWRFSSLNHQNFEFFGLVTKSPTQTDLICVKTLEPNISSLGPFKKIQPKPVLEKGTFLAELVEAAPWRPPPSLPGIPPPAHAHFARQTGFHLNNLKMQITPYFLI